MPGNSAKQQAYGKQPSHGKYTGLFLTGSMGLTQGEAPLDEAPDAVLPDDLFNGFFCPEVPEDSIRFWQLPSFFRSHHLLQLIQFQ